MEYLDVPLQIVQRVRAACAHLPEAYEEEAFAGVRWRIRGSTLTHLVTKVHPVDSYRLLAPKKLIARLDDGHHDT